MRTTKHSVLNHLLPEVFESFPVFIRGISAFPVVLPGVPACFKSTRTLLLFLGRCVYSLSYLKMAFICRFQAGSRSRDAWAYCPEVKTRWCEVTANTSEPQTQPKSKGLRRKVWRKQELLMIQECASVKHCGAFVVHVKHCPSRWHENRQNLKDL